MKALSILGTSSSAGKSWMTTAVCAWLRSQGVRVAPFKAQNMSNNGAALFSGGEIARAQVVQAEACGLLPVPEMNPILLKPSGGIGSQLVLNGEARGHYRALDYYRDFDRLWENVTGVLDGWKSKCDVLVMEGAGSPVELNLMDRDLVNLRPVRYLDGRWLLVGDIDRGGVYAQLAGTWNLMPEEDRARGLGAIVNKFRGDIRLFPDPEMWLAPHAPGLRVLGTVPTRFDLQPEEEDGLTDADADRGQGETLAWVRYPSAANLVDCQPWWDDTGVRLRWTADPAVLAEARAIVLPGTKNTIGDMRWLRETGLDRVICEAARRGTTVIGVCGGYQMLGEWLRDPTGVAGDAGEERGLGLLPLETVFRAPKIVCQTVVEHAGKRWTGYELHMGRTTQLTPCEPLNIVWVDGVAKPEGVRRGNVMATYLHGWFDLPELRAWVATQAGFRDHRAHRVPWPEKRQAVYRQMGEHIAQHLDLDPVRRYLQL